MQFNKSAYDRLYTTLIPFQNVNNIVIDCGNGQTLDWSKIGWNNEFVFNKSCFYQDK